jgi:hypothetical protein
MNLYRISTGNDFVWNQNDFLNFLVQNQHKSIFITNGGEGGCMQATGVYNLLDLFEFDKVTVKTGNSLESHHKYNIVLDPSRFRFFYNNHDYTSYHEWNRKKIFAAFYNRPIWYRIGLASYLQKYHANQTLLNFRHNPHSTDHRELFEMQNLFEIHPDSVGNFVDTMHSFPITVESTDGYTVGATTDQHTDQLARFYPDFFIDIVAETFVSGQTFFVTEKTVRPILLKKPFIIFGSQNYLEYLRQMGFRTFGDFWDETYDGYPATDRYVLILKLIDTLSKKSLDELQSMYYNMQYTLDHNYKLLTQHQYTRTIQLVQ